VQDIKITCVYFPCVRPTTEYMITFNEVLSFIESIFKSNVQSAHIVGGDLNFECMGPFRA